MALIPMMRLVMLLMGLALVAAACGVAESEQSDTPNPTESKPADVATTPPAATTSEAEDDFLPFQLLQVTRAWDTDFSNSTIDLNELQVGIPSSDPRDAIPPIDSPVFESVSDSEWIQDPEPGVLLDINGDARFYPLSVLTRHEIVNDEVGGTPVAVTYCPLCNTAVVFDRRFEEEVLRLGVSGLLRNSDLVMWDDSSQSLWQQITGEAIVGTHAGKRLIPIGSGIVRWADFKTTHPDGKALGPDQGRGTVYGYNPYEFYSSRARPYGFFTGEIDDRYPALERVVGVSVDGVDKAYPFSVINDALVVNDTVADRPVVVFWGAEDTADALDSGVIADAAGVGTGIAYDPIVDGRVLTFDALGDSEFVDRETGSAWSILGKAIDGELAGTELDLITHRNEFWFAWQAFFPDAEVWAGS